jgi:broad specificity phosphatase PhoE
MPPATWLSAPSAPPTVTLLLRHGLTQMTVEKRYAGTSDAPLNEAGLEQAAAAAKRLATAGLDAIVSSPLRRARTTASEVAALSGLQVVVDEGFRETDFGDWEGLTFAEVREQWPDVVAAWLADPEAGPPGGESFAAARRRIDAAMERVLAAHAGQKVLIVSHVGPIKALVASALQAPPSAIFRMHLDIAALSSIDWHADGRAVLRSYNDTAHLSQP